MVKFLTRTEKSDRKTPKIEEKGLLMEEASMEGRCSTASFKNLVWEAIKLILGMY